MNRLEVIVDQTGVLFLRQPVQYLKWYYNFSIFNRFIDWAFYCWSDYRIGFLGIKCCYELREIDVIKPIIKEANLPIVLECVTIRPFDCTRFFEFVCSRENTTELFFLQSTIQDSYTYQMMEGKLFNNKGNAITSFTWLGGATNESLKSLSNALKNENNQLTELVLVDITDLTDEAIAHLSDALKSENCKLAKLVLIPDLNMFWRKKIQAAFGSDGREGQGLVSGCNIGDKGIECLCEALKDNQCKLKTLCLSRYDITEESFKYLTDALRNENCKLKQLGICNDAKDDHRIIDSPACDELYEIAQEKNIIISHMFDDQSLWDIALTSLNVMHLKGDLLGVVVEQCM